MISDIKQKVKQFLTPKVKRNLELAILFFSTVFAVVSLVFSYITFQKTSDKVDQYVTIADNLRQPYFINFRLSTTGQCDINESSLLNINWNGTYTGCDCSKSSNLDIENIMYKNSCNISTQLGCTGLFPISQRTFQSIAMDLQGKNLALCGQRAKNANQFYRIAANQTGTCLQNQKMCGNPSIPTSVICVSQTDPCPIYQFHFTTTASTQYDSTWGHIQVNDNLHFYFDQQGTTANQLPVSQVVSTSGKGPCVFNVYNQTRYADEYLLFIWDRQLCDQDTNFIKTELVLTENQLYLYNLSDDDYNKVSNFTGYNIMQSKENYPIYYKPFIPWEIKSRNLLYPLVNFLLNAENLLNAIFYTLVVNAASVVYLGLIANGQHIYLLVWQKYEIDSEKVIKLKRYKLLISFLFKIASLVVSINAFILSSNYKSSLEDICSAKPTLDVYMQYFQALSDFTSTYIYKNNLINIIMTSANMVVDIVSAILEFLEYRNQLQESTKVVPASLQNLDQQTKEIVSLKQIEDQESQNNQNSNKQLPSYISVSKVRQKSVYPQTFIDNSGQKVILLSQNGLVFQNGMLRTLKNLPETLNNLES
ncbi:transmembrane protein, putative (macronuclear) [Tetrahymena thermophila SB210]|uniref:Transmembrane protein, putative n=1 Tax=Tetrahymena thermophila (strain SB210) TaxID=312017 RepID=I7M4D1_TETTS|nr:transmembrane protein, putative [Tetrahymena thermophila SB210]EAS06249.2 transmembrane protein, putative [Tetrahymena thermophila SB210]|eukprot:XP_001026494.2 transmembrane protein, putative [Tetrahymena thermophila SB210]